MVELDWSNHHFFFSSGARPVMLVLVGCLKQQTPPGSIHNACAFVAIWPIASSLPDILIHILLVAFMG